MSSGVQGAEHGILAGSRRAGQRNAEVRKSRRRLHRPVNVSANAQTGQNMPICPPSSAVRKVGRSVGKSWETCGLSPGRQKIAGLTVRELDVSDTRALHEISTSSRHPTAVRQFRQVRLPVLTFPNVPSRQLSPHQGCMRNPACRWLRPSPARWRQTQMRERLHPGSLARFRTKPKKSGWISAAEFVSPG